MHSKFNLQFPKIFWNFLNCFSENWRNINCRNGKYIIMVSSEEHEYCRKFCKKKAQTRCWLGQQIVSLSWKKCDTENEKRGRLAHGRCKRFGNGRLEWRVCDERATVFKSFRVTTTNSVVYNGARQSSPFSQRK